jgi:hypothetical protein
MNPGPGLRMLTAGAHRHAVDGSCLMKCLSVWAGEPFNNRLVIPIRPWPIWPLHKGWSCAGRSPTPNDLTETNRGSTINAIVCFLQLSH